MIIAISREFPVLNSLFEACFARLKDVRYERLEDGEDDLNEVLELIA